MEEITKLTLETLGELRDALRTARALATTEAARRALSIAITKVEEGALWTAAATEMER